MAASTAPALSTNLGFLTILRDTTGYFGGYLVTNPWGRPLEFRLSSAVQPNRVQQILYGQSLESYLCGDLIGKTLIDKTSTAAQFVFTDTPAALDLRRRLDQPVALVRLAMITPPSPPFVRGGTSGSPPYAGGTSGFPPYEGGAGGGDTAPPITCHAHFSADANQFRDLLAGLGSFDLSEPFTRIREAIAEARKLGVGAKN